MPFNTLLRAGSRKPHLAVCHTWLFCSAPRSAVSPAFSCPQRRPWALSLMLESTCRQPPQCPGLLLRFLGTSLSHLRPHCRSFLSTWGQKLPTGHRRLDILNELSCWGPILWLPSFPLIPPVTEATYSGPLPTNPSSSQWITLSPFHPSPRLPPISITTFFRPKQSLTCDSVTASELDSRFYPSSQRFLTRVQGLQKYYIFIFINLRLKFSISMSHEH